MLSYNLILLSIFSIIEKFVNFRK